jgi:hypothetical protein
MLLLGAQSLSAIGDENSAFIHMVCVPEIGFFEITPTHIWNIPKDKATRRLLPHKYSLFPEGASEFLCALKDSTVRVSYRMDLAAGLCGQEGRSRFLIGIWINERKVIDQVVFAEPCYSSGTTRISYSSASNGSIGFDAHPAYGMFDGGPMIVSFDAGLMDEKFNNLSAHDELLPITMEHINKRIDELTKKKN